MNVVDFGVATVGVGVDTVLGGTVVCTGGRTAC